MEQRTIDEILRDAPAVITGRQIRAARTLIGLSRLQLATLAGISEGTVRSIEHREIELSVRLETRLYLIDALWREGVRLLDNEGVERRNAPHE